MTGSEFRRTVTEEIPDSVGREITDPSGCLLRSTQDADPSPLRSGDGRGEGEEGKSFVWTPEEISRVFDNEADALLAAQG